MTGVVGPHDALFKSVLGKPGNAASQLRAVLPAELLSRLDLTQLRAVPGSFVDEELRWRHSDLLFTAPLVGESDRSAFVYVLVEHQSSTDRLMPYRVLRYVVRIWDRYVADNPKTRLLPAVIPLVVHHDRSPWSGPVEVSQLIDMDNESAAVVGEFLPRLRFLLDDLAVVDEQGLRVRPLTAPARMALVLLKVGAGGEHLVSALERWVDQLGEVLARPGGVEEFLALLRYIEYVGEPPVDQLRALVDRLGSQAQEAYVTIAELLRKEGLEEGLEEGREEGRVEGEARGRAEVLVQLLTLKFGPLPPDTLQVVRTATIDQLETWTARVLTADTLDQIFA